MRAKTPAAVPGSSSGDPDARVTQALLTQGKIAAVKLCRELHPGMDLAGAKARVDQLEANLPAGSGVRKGGAGCLLLVATLLLAAGCWGGVILL